MNDWSLAEQHAERAWRHYEAGRWDHALRLLRRALTINPDQCDWLFGLGLTLDAMSRYDEAADAYRKVLEHEPNDHEALLHLGMDLIRLGQPAEALEFWQDRMAEAGRGGPPDFLSTHPSDQARIQQLQQVLYG